MEKIKRLMEKSELPKIQSYAKCFEELKEKKEKEFIDNHLDNLLSQNIVSVKISNDKIFQNISKEKVCIDTNLQNKEYVKLYLSDKYKLLNMGDGLVEIHKDFKYIKSLNFF